MTPAARIALLTTLRAVHPYLLPEDTLLTETNLRLARPQQISGTEFAELLRELESEHAILSQRDQFRRLRWKITDDGLARLSELRS